jgi:RNase adaptor protein for sRNA GlmZ degradation
MVAKTASGKLIVFAGTVGAGKSTHLRLLYSYLKMRDIIATATFLKTANLMAYLLLKVIAAVCGLKRNHMPLITALNESRPSLFKAVSFLFTLADTFSIVIKYLFRVWLPFKLGRVVLVEEYLPATVFDYFVLLKVRKVVTSRSFNVLYKLCALLASRTAHVSNIVLFFDAPNHVLFERYSCRGSFKERKLYLEMQRKLLPSLYSKFLGSQVVFLDSSNPAYQLQLLIRSKVGAILKYSDVL